MTTELLLTGLLPSTLHSILLSTLSQLCERAESYSLTEKVFKRKGATTGDARIRVRALRLKSEQVTHTTGDSTRWSLTVLHRPEPERISPQALQYSVSEISLAEGVHPEELVNAFGFEEKDFELRKRGTRWERSGVLIEVYQLFPDEVSTEPLDPVSFVVQASVRFSQPTSTAAASSTSSKASNKRTSTPNSGPTGGGGGGNSGQEERDRALNALEGVKRALKGVVDLRRIE
ncbi:hypothetical protein JCM3765_003618 [Sporobolomyces pararoseus]